MAGPTRWPRRGNSAQLCVVAQRTAIIFSPFLADQCRGTVRDVCPRFLGLTPTPGRRGAGCGTGSSDCIEPVVPVHRAGELSRHATGASRRPLTPTISPTSTPGCRPRLSRGSFRSRWLDGETPPEWKSFVVRPGFGRPASRSSSAGCSCQGPCAVGDLSTNLGVVPEPVCLDFADDVLTRAESRNWAVSAGTRQSSTSRRSSVARWWVHVGLIVTAAVSLVLEPALSLHILIGLVFVGLVVAHLVQRRRVSASLLKRLGYPGTWLQASGRLAVADSALAAVTVVMLASGLWDWLSGHPTKLRWHAISGVILTGFLIGHTLRRRGRLRSSRIR